MRTVIITIIVVLSIAATCNAGSLDVHHEYITRVGHTDMLLQGSGYVNFTCPAEFTGLHNDGNGTCQMRFKQLPDWPKEGMEIEVLVINKNKVVKLQPKK